MRIDADGDRRDLNETGDATRRTHLANERTQLAWWRTGLASLAVGVGVGRVVPELSGQAHLGYAILGVAFVVYGIGFIVAGTWRQRQVEEAVMDARWRAQERWLVLWMTAIGVALSLATAVLILVDA